MEFQSAPIEQRYELGLLIGRGHYATVQYCVNLQTKESFAAKIIKKKRIEASRLGMKKEDIVREARILKQMDHANIIKIYDAFELQNSAVLILELVRGGELFQYIWEKGTLSEEEASKFIRQILLGINHIHSKNVLHLDLKPENILVEDINTQKIKIIDFGLAREIGTKPVLELQGTPEFVAPEIINYDPLSFATDMWSVGIITFIMLTGFSPFHGESRNETFNNITKCDLDLSDEHCSTLSNLAKEFMSSLIVKSAPSRLTSQQCLEHDWIRPELKNIQKKRNSYISKNRLSKLIDFVVSPVRPTSVIYMDNDSKNSSRLSLPVQSINLLEIEAQNII